MKRAVQIAMGTAVVALTAAFTYGAFVRPWLLTWGATSDEVGQTLPGDEIVPHAVHQYTRAITINAPAEKVWPWLVQIGQGRGGFYSYDWIENLLGFDIHSADRIVPDLQHLQLGDTVRMNREGSGTPSFTVSMISPNRALVLRGGDSYSWAFVLQPVDADRTRLIIRARTYTDPDWAAPLLYVEPVTFIMEREMLRGIKERAERA